MALPAPARFLDTRLDGSTFDGGDVGLGVQAAESTLRLRVAARGGVPADVAAVSLNVTVTEPVRAGFVTVFACGEERPTASSLNYAAQQTVANLVVSAVGADRTICLFTKSPAHLVVDIAGYFPAGGALRTLRAPARLLDTRADGTTIDGTGAAGGIVVSGSLVRVMVAGRGGLPSAPSSVLLNVTVADAVLGGFVTVYGCDGDLPTASNLNYAARQTVANFVMSRVSAAGEICLYASGTTHVIVDVAGWFDGTDAITFLSSPSRLLDTREGGLTIDGSGAGGGLRPAGGTVMLAVAGRGAVPANATAVVLNVTVADPGGAGYVTVYPAGASQPVASNLNFVHGQTVPNAVIARVGSSRSICLYTHAAAHLVVDVAAYIVDPSASAATQPCPADPVQPAPTAPPVATPPAPGPVVKGAGTYLVGSGIPAGRYIARGAVLGCYWERERGLSGELADVIANDFLGNSGPVIVDIAATDVAFKFTAACGTMRQYEPPASPVAAFGPGSYVVGGDIVAGTYAATAQSGCYWQRSTSFDGELSSIIANDFVSSAGPVLVAISATDVGFTADGDCGTWVRV